MLNRIGRDVLLWVVSAVVCILWRVLAAKSEVAGYICAFAVMMVAWIVLGLLFRKYRSYRDVWYWQEMLSMVLTGGTLFGLIWLYGRFGRNPLSMNVLVSMIVIVGVFDSVVILIKHYWKYATNMSVTPMEVEQRSGAVVSSKSEARSTQSMGAVHDTVLSLTTEEDYQMLLERAKLDDRQTKIVANTKLAGFLQIPDYQYLTLVDLCLLNDVKGINKRFCTVNQKLPDDGRYVCCYRPQEYVKNKILARYPKPLNWVVYSLFFFHKRVVPRLLLTSRLYYDLTKGRKRMLSKTEVLGRLYYCGFEVDEVVPMGHIEYVFAHRAHQPYPQERMKLYGPLIKLPRVCKDKQIVYFYKFRTMHPYSEYIQNYVFDQHGGMNISDKSDNDFRITSWGRLMRRYWLDELPMLINWLKRDVKLVGIRPLSRSMFEKYPPALQDKRTRVKPGLIPPFYIDHPQTFDELFASEDKYLTEYLEHPVRTDLKYFWLTIHAILFKKMHSA